MSADIYSYFLGGKSDKVKVYGTERKSEPFEMPKRVLKRAYPFVIASAMLLAGCGKSNNGPQPQDTPNQETVISTKTADTLDKSPALVNEYDSIYNKVVTSYNLTQLKEKEPLPQAKIMQLLSDSVAPDLKDTNYNHLPENQDNFWEIVKNGVKVTREIQESPSISDKEKKEYKITVYKTLSQISRIKGTEDEIDLTDYNNLKAFAYFEKLTYYGADYEHTLKKEKGIINESNELYGRYYKDYNVLYETAKKYPGVEKFIEALYDDPSRFVLSKTAEADSTQANQLAQKMLSDWMEKQRIDDEGLYRFVSVNDGYYVNQAAFYFRRGTDMRAALHVDPSGDLGDGDYSPLGSTLIHELQHVMQMKPASREYPEDNSSKADVIPVRPEDEAFRNSMLPELGPTLYSLVIEDSIYKQIHKIDINQVVDDYGALEVAGRKVKFGEIANKMRHFFFEKYADEMSIDKVLVKPDVMQQLNEWGGKANLKVLMNNRGGMGN